MSVRKCRCGAVLPVQTGPGRPRKWCDECKRKRVRVVKPDPAVKVCERERCGEPLPEGIRSHARYCSRECQKRAYDEVIVAHCSDCGAGISRHAARKKKGTRCRACFEAGRRRAWEARAGIIADLWEDGLTVREIAAELGWSKELAALEIIRVRRWRPELVPYRRSPEAVANIRAGWAEARRRKAA